METTTVTVLSQEQYDAGPFDFGADYEDGTLRRVLASLLAIRERIPAEYRDAARCGIESVGSYENSHYASISVSYVRPATPEEIAERRASARDREEERRRTELATLRALQAKYGADAPPS